MNVEGMKKEFEYTIRTSKIRTSFNNPTLYA